MTIVPVHLLLLLSCVGDVVRGDGVSRVFSVSLKSLQPGPDWLLASWDSDHVDRAADTSVEDADSLQDNWSHVEGHLEAILLLMWSTEPGLTNRLYLKPSLDEKGFSPRQHTFSDLLPATWYAVCLNATHVGPNFRRPTYSCSATQTLHIDGGKPQPSIISRDVSAKIGASWADITVLEFNTPFTIVRWEVEARRAKSTKLLKSSSNDNGENGLDEDNEIKNYDDDVDDIEEGEEVRVPDSSLSEGELIRFNEHHGVNTPSGVQHVFHLEGLAPATTYFISMRAWYKVNVRHNLREHEHRDYYAITTLVSGGGRPQRTANISVFITLILWSMLRHSA